MEQMKLMFLSMRGGYKMSNVTKFTVFDTNEKNIGHIKNIISARHFSELNGEDYLEIESLDKHLKRDYRILYHNRYYNKLYEFIIKEVVEYKEGNQIISRITAENSIVETMGDFIEGRVLLGKTYTEVLDDFLLDTRWRGVVVDEGIEPQRRTIKIGKMNVRSAINIISEQYDLEMETFIELTGENKIIRRIGFSRKRGKNRGQRLTYGRGSSEISRKISSDELITALYAYGDDVENEHGESETVKLPGKGYLENNVARENYGRLDYNGEEKRHVFGMKEYSGVKTQGELIRRAQKDLRKMSSPKISYEIKIKDYVRILNSMNNYIELGDEVRIIDRDFSPEIDILSRVIRIEMDIVNFENSVLTINDVPNTMNDRLVPGLNYEGFEDDTQGDPDSLINIFPRLRQGLSLWIDADNVSTIETAGLDNKITEIKNAVTYYEDINEEYGSNYKRKVFEQEDVEKAPSYKNMLNRRWISFEPEDQIYHEWSGDERPDDVEIQDGQFIEFLRKDDVIRSIYIVFYDRTHEFIPGGLLPQYGYRAGYSTPLGYGWQSAQYYDSNGLWPSTPGEDRVIGPVTGWKMGRIRNQILIANPKRQPNRIFPSIQNLGMNKESYESYRSYAAERRYGGTKYEQNTFFRGEIAEIIAHRRELDIQEKEAVEKYLTEKYGVSKIYK